MNRISILSPSLADKIAAGEVVERPFNVVKELVENSVDAQATKIEIIIKDGGRSLIEIRDNGCGMSKEDAILSIKRHATSKIKTDYDLFSIQTMGFRGEALSAISAVSKFTLMTCEQGENGTQLLCVNSHIESIEPCAMPQGTIIKVEELFYNTPARLKYLKSDNSEFALIADIVNKLALAHPKIWFRLTHNDKIIFQSNGNGNLLDILASIYGVSIAKNMIYFENHNHDFVIHGFTSDICISKANKYSIFAFVNQRYVRNKNLTDSIIKAYHELLFENRYPYTVLYVDADPTILDVNIHPTKQDIRISKEFELNQMIEQTIHETITKTKPINEVKIKSSTPIDDPQKNQQGFMNFDVKEQEITYNQTNHPSDIDTSSLISFDQKEYQTNTTEYYPIGQIHGTYIVAQSSDGFILIDQHAAAERIRYEKYQQLFLENHHSIDLLVPLIIELPIRDFQEIVQHLDLLKEVKIEAEPFGDHAIKITHVPYYLDKIDLNLYVETILQQIINHKKIDLHELKDYAIATLACKASLKANSHLSTADMEKIIHDLFLCHNPYTCPHGRPTILKYSLAELQKAFKRT